ncbi:MAG TPA: glutamate 5-kinase [Spirochaetales bacterium]|nr:glutamate 5-kinase [Spirochaetales bacterium]HRZ63584.1 glutamate 5-kinase [Spirochaetia bacterium]
MAGTEGPRKPGAASAAERAARRALAESKRVVIKIGTNTIARPKDAPGRLSGGPDREAGGIDAEFLHRVAAELADLSRAGREIIVVTSGAVGMGARELGLAKRPKDLRTKQACAAIGQSLLMDEYRRAFGVYGLTAAQVLVTRYTWDDREAYLNLRSTVEVLLERRVIPVFNENDAVSTAEIAFGDNDQLSAYVASKIDAELLVILSDVDMLYDANPREDPGARPIPYVRELGPEILGAAGGKGTEFSTGGMRTKLLAVGIARDARCRVVIAHGRESRAISRILAGERVGTLFEAASGLRNRDRWIKNKRPKGRILVDPGALAAMRGSNSLLPAGVVGVEGSFERGDVVLVNDAAKVISSLSSAELLAAKGRRTEELESVLGEGAARVVARPGDTVFLEG